MKVKKLTSKIKLISDALEADRISAKQILQANNEIQKLQQKFAQQIEGLKESASSSDKHAECSDMELNNLRVKSRRLRRKTH